MHARNAELAELRNRLTTQTSHGMTLGENLAEKSGKLSLVEGELAEAKEAKAKLEVEVAEYAALVPDLRRKLGEVEGSLERELARSKQLEDGTRGLAEARAEVAQTTAEKEQLSEQLSLEAEQLQNDLNAAQSELADVKAELAGEVERHAATKQSSYDERDASDAAWNQLIAAKDSELDAAVEAHEAAEEMAARHAATIETLSKQHGSSSDDAKRALEQSQEAASSLQSVNAALERRAEDAEAKLAANGEASDEAVRLRRALDESTALAVSIRQDSDAALATAQAETAELRQQIRQMIAHHSDHEAQAEADAEDAVVLRDENARVATHLASVESQLHAERKGREQAENLYRDAVAVADMRVDAARAEAEATSPTGDARELGKMLEQRERLEDLQDQLYASRAAVEKMRKEQQRGGGFFGEGILKSLGLSNGVNCLGTERKRLGLEHAPAVDAGRLLALPAGGETYFERDVIARGDSPSLRPSLEVEYADRRRESIATNATSASDRDGDRNYANEYAAAAAEMPIPRSASHRRSSHRSSKHLVSPSDERHHRDRRHHSREEEGRPSSRHATGYRHSSGASRGDSLFSKSGGAPTPSKKPRPPKASYAKPAGLRRAETAPPHRAY